MKRPIVVSEIREGDLIRVEAFRPSSEPWGDTAHEYRASSDGDAHGWIVGRFNWFLLDRPEPAVALPTEPTLGWLTWRVEQTNNRGNDLDFWSGPGSERGAAMRGFEAGETHLYPADVTAFTPATAVPQDAIEELEDAHMEWQKDANRGLAADVAHFLNRIYEANEAQR